MQERESAIKDINTKMHQVNEIYKVSGIQNLTHTFEFSNFDTGSSSPFNFLLLYENKDLGQIVNAQQDQIDKVENMIEESNDNTFQGLGHLQSGGKNDKCMKSSAFKNRTTASKTAIDNCHHTHDTTVSKKSQGVKEYINQIRDLSRTQCGLGLTLDVSEVRNDLRELSVVVKTLGERSLEKLQGAEYCKSP